MAGDSNDQWDIFLHVLQAHNFPPVALAGEDVSVYVGTSVVVDGSNSYDPDASAAGAGPVSAYRWTLLDKPLTSTLSLTDTTSASVQFVPDVAGDYVLELVVNDGVQDSVADSVTITALNNLPPQAVIQIDPSSGAAPLIVTVSAAQSSDPDGDSMTYHWDFGDAQASVDNPNTSDAMDASHTYHLAGDYQVLLTVTDSVGNVGQSSHTVTVSNANHAPVINPAASVQSGGAPLNVQFFANASDADNDSLTFTWDFGDGSAVVQTQDPQHVFTQSGTFTVTLRVSDGNAEVSASLLITVDSAFNFDVHRAYLELDTRRPKHDKLALELVAASVQTLNADDVVSIRVDGFELLSMSVAQIQSLTPISGHHYDYGAQDLSSHDAESDSTLRYAHESQEVGFPLIQLQASGDGLKIRLKMSAIDFNNQLNLQNGLDIQLQIGAQSGLKNILLTRLPTHCESLRAHRDDGHACGGQPERSYRLRYYYGATFTDKHWLP